MDTSETIRRHRLNTALGVALVYAEYLPERRSADIVMVHGLASSGVQFQQEALRFAGKGHRVIVPDLRGHGASGVPARAIDVEDFSITTRAMDLIAVLDHADADDFHWLGNSLGGILALWLLGTPHHERLQSLALFGTCFSMDLPTQVNHLLRLSFLPGAPATAWLIAPMTTTCPLGRGGRSKPRSSSSMWAPVPP